VVRHPDETKAKRKSTIDGKFKSLVRDKNISLTLFIVNTYQSFNMLSNTLFQRFVTRINPECKLLSKTKLTKTYIPLCSQLVKKAVEEELNKKTVCLIVDEMSKNGHSYFNILLSTVMKTGGRAKTCVFFWDSISIQSQTAQNIGRVIVDTIEKLKGKEIRVNAYVSDSCPSMQASKDVVNELENRHIVRIPCACHALNLVFKSIMEMEEILPFWENVVVCSCLIL